MENMRSAAVFAQTNDAQANELVAFSRDAEGRLAGAGRFATGGRGTGAPHLPSQGSIAIDAEGSRLIVANAGSDDISLFTLGGGTRPGGRACRRRGRAPVSVTIHGGTAYVLNAGDGSIAGFTVGDTSLTPLAGSQRVLPGETDAAQIAFTPDGRSLVVTDRATNSIVVFPVDEQGLAGEPAFVRVLGRDAVRLRLRGRRGARRHRGLRRPGRRCRRLVLSRRGRGRAARQRLRRGHAQRGLLGGRVQGRRRTSG